MIDKIACPFNDNHVEAYNIPAYDTDGHLLNMCFHGDDDADVIKARQALADDLGTDFSHMVCPHQEHTANIREVSLKDGGRGIFSREDAFAATDGLYTKDKGLTLMTFHADCVPVLLYAPDIPLIAAVHSGWKGTTLEIAGKAVELLVEKEHIDPSQLKACIGPGIEHRNFEAMSDIIDLVKAMSFDTSDYYTLKDETHWLLNSKGLIQKTLETRGVLPENIYTSDICTIEDERFFSYRGTHTRNRNVSVITMK